MRLPRFRIRTLMIAVAVVAGLFLVLRSVHISVISPNTQAIAVDLFSMRIGGVVMVTAAVLFIKKAKSP